MDNYVKLCEKTVLSCPENVMKSFTVLSSECDWSGCADFINSWP